MDLNLLAGRWLVVVTGLLTAVFAASAWADGEFDSVVAGVLLVAVNTLPLLLIARNPLIVVWIFAVSIHAAAMLHHSLPSAVRASASSGVSAISWLAFLPVAIGSGILIDAGGVDLAGYVVAGVAAGVLLTVWLSHRHHASSSADTEAADRRTQ